LIFFLPFDISSSLLHHYYIYIRHKVQVQSINLAPFSLLLSSIHLPPIKMDQQIQQLRAELRTEFAATIDNLQQQIQSLQQAHQQSIQQTQQLQAQLLQPAQPAQQH
jgi:hypothetical protein